MTTTDVRGQQVTLLQRLSALKPAPFLMGGFAEDALLYGDFSRDHEDIDLLVERSELERLLQKLSTLGYDEWETWGETAVGEPFYLSKRANDLLMDIAVTDRTDSGELYLELGRVFFRIEEGDPPVGYRVYLPENALTFPAVTFNGFAVRTISPLANFQLRAGIASQGSFGQLRPKDKLSMSRLQAKFFPDVNADDFLPRIERVQVPLAL